jgi:predicted adenine nucleotide alpha hydrolase (AANH) superfamily ATPase
LLIHVCCSVDSHYFIQKIQEEYPDEKIVCFFYDPNIHPYSEYKLRLQDVQFSCDILNIELIEGAYDLETWLSLVKGLENEPEKGDRCTVCFDRRLDVSALKALELGHDKFTTTLLISPKKSQDKLEIIGENLSKEHGLEFIFRDYRSGNGVEMQGKQVKEHSLYRQNYCGCLFGLVQQRDQQDKLMDEMISPISQQILPESIEERLELYKYRNDLYLQDVPYQLIKQRFLNYRLLSGCVKIQKQTVYSYFLAYSTLKSKKTNGRVEHVINDIAYFNRDELKIISITKFNELANTQYKNVQELNYNTLEFSKEVELRNEILDSAFDMSCVVVLDEIPTLKLDITLDAKVYDDVREKIILK